MSRRRTHRLVPMLIAAATVAVLGVAAPMAATAAPAASVTVSSDGVSYGASLRTALFAGAAIVPNGSVTRSFWVRNERSDAGNLAIAIRDVAGADAIYLAALSVSARSGADTGPKVGFWGVQPCAPLLTGVVLRPAEAVRVDVTIALVDLVGQTAQGSSASFDLVAQLTSTDAAAPNGCAAVVPPPPAPGGSGGTGGTSPGGHSSASGSASGGSIVIPGTGTGAGAGGGQETPGQVPDGPSLGGLLPNTDRFYQELFVGAWVIELILGGALAVLLKRRKEARA